MTEVARLPAPDRKLRTHVTVPVEDLAELLACAEEIGARRALVGQPILAQMESLIINSSSHEARVHRYTAELLVQYGG